MRQDETKNVTGPDLPQLRRTRVPLWLVLLGVVLCVALAPLALFGWLTIDHTQDALVTAQQERQLQQAAAIAQRLQSFVEQEGREATKLSESLAHTDASEPMLLRSLLSDFLDDTLVMARLNRAGDASVDASRPDFVLTRPMAEALDRDVAQLLERASNGVRLSTPSGLISGPFSLGPQRSLAITVSSPVLHGGELVGIYQGVAVFQEIWEQALAANPAPTRLFLITPGGEIVARSAAEAAETPTTIRRRDVVQQWVTSRGRSSGARRYEMKRGGDETLRCLGSIASTSDGWGVFVEVDERLALAPVARLRSQVLFGGIVAALLALGAAVVLGGVISRPVTRLAQISKRLAEGDFSVRADASRVAELDDLGQHFNGMARRLGELVERFRAAAREVNDMFLGTIRALSEAIDEKDPYTKGHSVRVSRYSVIIGRYLGHSPEEMRALHVSSLLHDVGKIGIDDAILKKPAALTPDEFEVMKTHPDRGVRILGRIPQMRGMMPGIRFHHERWRGGGYPLGIKGEEIPLQARVIAVADTFDAMTTNRPYQKAFTVEQAVAKINDFKGVSLDPDVVEAFNRAYEAGELAEIIATRPGVSAASPPPAAPVGPREESAITAPQR